MVEKASSTVDTVGQACTCRTDSGELPPLVKPDSVKGSRSGVNATIQEKLETRAVGRALISFGLIVTLAAILVANLPNSEIKNYSLRWAQPYLTAVGLGEEWGVFAPNPRNAVIYVTGHIDYSDGTSSVWSFPIRSGLMAYSDYRWQKFEEQVRTDNNSQLWQPFAEYLANHASTALGHEPVRVSLVRRWAELQPPGVTPALGPWHQFVYYVSPVERAK